MLADPYKCLKNVAIDCHSHCRILENALRMLQMLTNAVTNNANVLQTPCDCVANACRIVFICHLLASIIVNNINVNQNPLQCQGACKKLCHY